MSSSSGAEQILTSPTQQQANAPVEKYRQGSMDPHLLALASSGSYEELRTLLNAKEEGQPSSNVSLPTRRASSYDDDTEANESILEGVTAEGDTALHVVAACGQGDNFCTRSREAKPLLQQNKWRWWRGCWCLTSGQRHALLTSYGYGDGDDFLESARIIYRKAKHLLLVQNNNGDTPLHGAARAEKSNMVACLIDLAVTEGEYRMKELLRKENEHKETALHEAVRVGNKDIVDLLMEKDSELASFPQDSGASPMYLAIILKHNLIEAILYEKGHGKLSFSGPNGQNALHAAVLRCHQDLTKLLENNKDLTAQRDKNGSTPLHFAASLFSPSRVCRQVLEANPDALYQPDHAGFFPIHIAASVGAFRNVDMFVKQCPGSAGLRDAKGRTFLHVAVDKRTASIIWSTCRNLSLSWIMNMVDNDGNTALHLAVEAGKLQLFCPLLGNPQVNLNLSNNIGETALDIAEYKTPQDGWYYYWNSEVEIRRALRIAGAVEGAHRQDHLLEDNRTVREKQGEGKKMEALKLKDSTQTLCIGSVLITTVTFGATFAAPGGYIADDHNHGGSPILARRYAFDAFIVANTLTFVFSTIATIGLMYSGTPLSNPGSRQIHLGAAIYLLSISITSLAAAFALGAYAVLAPVTHKTAVATCVLTCLVPLYTKLELIWTHLLLLPPLYMRKGIIWTLKYLAQLVLCFMLFEYWPLIFIFGWATHTSHPEIEAASCTSTSTITYRLEARCVNQQIDMWSWQYH